MPPKGVFGSAPQVSAPLFSALPPAERAMRNAFYLACAALAGWMLWRALHPVRPFQIDRINKDMGLWSLRFLFACLALSPLSRWLKAPTLRRWRRPLGLAAFAFAALHTGHFLLYGRLWPDRLDILFKRPYMTLGLIALVLLVPLALTSADVVVRWIKPRRWRLLHLLIYPAAALSVIHEVMAYGPLKGEAGLYSVLTVLFLVNKGVRLVREAWPRKPRPLAVAA